MGAPDSNPFDFSDFGQRASTGPSRPQTRPGGGFDPFNEESSVAQRDLTEDEVFAGAGQGGGEQSGTQLVAGPPLRLVAMAAAVAVTGIVLGAVVVTARTPITLAFAGWLLAGPVAIGGLAVFTHIDTRRRSHSVYSAPTWLTTAYWLVVAICGIGVGIGAWQIALWAGRQ